jgi:hypothetical protein
LTPLAGEASVARKDLPLEDQMNRKQLIVLWALAVWLLFSMWNAGRWTCTIAEDFDRTKRAYDAMETMSQALMRTELKRLERLPAPERGEAARQAAEQISKGSYSNPFAAKYDSAKRHMDKYGSHSTHWKWVTQAQSPLLAPEVANDIGWIRWSRFVAPEATTTSWIRLFTWSLPALVIAAPLWLTFARRQRSV